MGRRGRHAERWSNLAIAAIRRGANPNDFSDPGGLDWGQSTNRCANMRILWAIPAGLLVLGPVAAPAQQDEMGLDIPTFLRRQSN